MPTEEEQQQPGTGDAQQQEQLEPPSTAASKESPATVQTPTSDATVENEQKSDTCKAERRSMEEESSPQTKSEPSSTKDVEEDRKTEQVVPVDSTSASEHVKKDESQSDATKGDSSPTPQQQQELSTSSSDEVPALVKGPPTPVPSRQDEDDDEEEEDDEGDNEDQEEQQQSSQPQRQQQRSSKQRSAGSRDGYNNEDESQNQRQDQSQTPTGGQYYEDDEEDDEDEGEEPSELRQLFEPISECDGFKLDRTGLGLREVKLLVLLPPFADDSQALSEDEEDGDYIPDEEVKKTIMVGSDFQAVIPEGLCRYDDALPYENEDKLLWNPTILNEQQIEDYLVKITAPGGGGLGAGGGAAAPAGQQGSRAAAGAANEAQPNSVYALPLGNHLRDDEQSLYLLQQCGHNVDEALRRKRISNNAVPVPEQQMSIWSEEECRNFENGLRVHGKDFHMIQQTKVRRWCWAVQRGMVFGGNGDLETNARVAFPTPGTHPVRRRAGTVLLPVEENRTARSVREQGAAREEKVQPAPGADRPHGSVSGGAGKQYRVRGPQLVAGLQQSVQ